MENQEKETKERLKITLPYGANAEIKRLVFKTTGRTISASQVGNVLDPDKKAWDNDVISIALDLAAENLAKRQVIAEKMESLTGI